MLTLFDRVFRSVRIKSNLLNSLNNFTDRVNLSTSDSQINVITQDISLQVCQKKFFSCHFWNSFTRWIVYLSIQVLKRRSSTKC